MRYSVIIEQAIEVLNRLLEADRCAITELLDLRVNCNEELGECLEAQTWKSEEGQYSIRPLGILNALFGVDENGCGRLASQYIMSVNKENFVLEKFIDLKGKENE